MRGWRNTLLGVAMSCIAGLAAAQQSAERAPQAPAESPPEAAEKERIPLDGDAFRALFEGKTIHLSAQGRYFGSEYYKSGDRSLWKQAGQPCMPGVWYYEKPFICFRYEGSGPHCWTVYQRGPRFYARSKDGFELRIETMVDAPMNCAPELYS